MRCPVKCRSTADMLACMECGTLFCKYCAAPFNIQRPLHKRNDCPLCGSDSIDADEYQEIINRKYESNSSDSDVNDNENDDVDTDIDDDDAIVSALVNLDSNEELSNFKVLVSERPLTKVHLQKCAQLLVEGNWSAAFDVFAIEFPEIIDSSWVPELGSDIRFDMLSMLEKHCPNQGDYESLLNWCVTSYLQTNNSHWIAEKKQIIESLALKCDSFMPDIDYWISDIEFLNYLIDTDSSVTGVHLPANTLRHINFPALADFNLVSKLIKIEMNINECFGLFEDANGFPINSHMRYPDGIVEVFKKFRIESIKGIPLIGVYMLLGHLQLFNLLVSSGCELNAEFVLQMNNKTYNNCNLLDLAARMRLNDYCASLKAKGCKFKSLSLLERLSI